MNPELAQTLDILQQPLFPEVSSPPPHSEGNLRPDEILVDVLGGPLAGTIGRAFDLMETAEEEIAAAMRRHPEKAEQLNAAFHLLCPPDLLCEAPELLYGFHAGELLERVASGADTRPGTDAECLWALCQLSLRAPLQHDWCVAYFRLFERLFPRQALDIAGGHLQQETYAGAVDEILQTLRRRLARERSCRAG